MGNHHYGSKRSRQEFKLWVRSLIRLELRQQEVATNGQPQPLGMFFEEAT